MMFQVAIRMFHGGGEETADMIDSVVKSIELRLKSGKWKCSRWIQSVPGGDEIVPVGNEGST